MKFKSGHFFVIHNKKRKAPFVIFDWNRSETLALAKEGCVLCHGFGLRRGNRKGLTAPCNCVLRAIFRACYARFRYCASKEKHITQARLEKTGGKERRKMWGRKNEEFSADFCLVSKRVLDELEYKIFNYHYLLGADWRLCCRRLGLDKGTFFHSIYRIEQKLGRVFRELQPYSLFPLDEYFGGSVRGRVPAEYRNLVDMPALPRQGPVRPPLRKVA
jgi:hypothetical protein